MSTAVRDAIRRQSTEYIRNIGKVADTYRENNALCRDTCAVLKLDFIPPIVGLYRDYVALMEIWNPVRLKAQPIVDEGAEPNKHLFVVIENSMTAAIIG